MSKYATLFTPSIQEIYEVTIFSALPSDSRLISTFYVLLFPTGSYHTNIKAPIMKAINSSAIKVELRNTPRLNARELWGAAKKNEIACFLGSTPVHHFKNLTGAYPISVVLASLRNFTTYKCNALYFGNMYGHEYNIVSAFEARHTAENSK